MHIDRMLKFGKLQVCQISTS